MESALFHRLSSLYKFTNGLEDLTERVWDTESQWFNLQPVPRRATTIIFKQTQKKDNMYKILTLRIWLNKQK